MPLDFKVEKIRVVTGSMEYTISAVAVTDPNGVVTEPSGSIIRSQDGEIWVNTNGGTTWAKTGPGAFSGLSGTVDSGIKAAYVSLQAGITGSVSNAYTVLQSGITGSSSNLYTTILAGTSASDAAVYSSLQSGITGSVTTAVAGSVNSVAKFTAANVVGNSSIVDDGNNVSTSTNEFHLNRSDAGDATGWINYYSTTTTDYFRTLNIGDGKGALIASFSGPTKAVALAGDVLVTGSITGSGDVLFSRDATVSRNQIITGFITGSGLKVNLGGGTGGEMMLATLNYTGAGAQNPGMQLQSNNTTGFKVTHPNAFQSVLLDHNYASATRIGLGLRGTEEFYVNTTQAHALGDMIVSGSLTGSGDVRLGRDLTIVGIATASVDLRVGRNLVITGSANIGSATTDEHVIYGLLDFNGTPGATSQVLGMYNGLPRWIHLSGAGGVSGLGTNNYIPKWSGQYALGDSPLLDFNGVVNCESPLGASGGGNGANSGQIFANVTGSSVADDVAGVYSSVVNSIDSTAAARNVYGVRILTSVSRSLGSNTVSNYGLHVDASDAGDVTNTYSIYTVKGDVVLGNGGVGVVNNGSTKVKGVFYAEGDVILNNTPNSSFSTEIKGYTYFRSGSYTEGSLTGSGDALFSRKVDVGGSVDVAGSLTGSGDVSFENDLSVAGSITGSAYMVAGNAGRIKIGHQILTATTGTYTPTSGARAVRLRMVGGGGGGGGTAGAANPNTSVGSGGSSGVYMEKWITPGGGIDYITGGGFACGAGGAGGASGGGNGTDGGETSIVINGFTYRAKGGGGGSYIGATSTFTAQIGSKPGTGSTVSSVDSHTFIGGGHSFCTANVAIAGAGGSSPFGAGGVQQTVAAGVAGTGYGAGGSGAVSTTTNFGGGAGSDGIIIVEEFS